MTRPIDPLDRLRAQAANGAPSRQDPEQLDGPALLAEIERRTAGTGPGSETRRRRNVRAGAAGAALAAMSVTAVIAAQGVLPTGLNAPLDDGIVPAAASATSQRLDGSSTGTATSEQTPVVMAAAYVKDAKAAVDKEVHLADFVLREDRTTTIKHPGEKRDSSASQEFTAGDGSATRWRAVKDWDAAVGASSVGVEDVKHVDPDGPKGQMTYWWVNVPKGIYTRFPVSTDHLGVEPVQKQIVKQLRELRRTLDVITKLAESPGVTVGEPEAWVRDGVSATCFTVSGTGPSGQLGFGAADPATIDWERRVCFDDATDLPILDEPSQRYQLEDRAEPSVMAETIEYRWLPLDEESRKLLDPPIDGLTEVDHDTYVELSS